MLVGKNNKIQFVAVTLTRCRVLRSLSRNAWFVAWQREGFLHETHPGTGTRTRKYTKSLRKSSEGLRISPDVFGEDWIFFGNRNTPNTRRIKISRLCLEKFGRCTITVAHVLWISYTYHIMDFCKCCVSYCEKNIIKTQKYTGGPSSQCYPI